MDAEVARKILDVQEAAMEDTRYLALLSEYRTLSERLMNMSHAMSPEQQDVLTDLMGVVYMTHLRMLEIAFSQAPPASIPSPGG